VVLSIILSPFASAEIRAILIVVRRKPATDATQAAGADKTVLKIAERNRAKNNQKKQSKMGGNDEAEL
jgi:hypothetical protein